jgi:signal transduction histidine kinase
MRSTLLSWRGVTSGSIGLLIFLVAAKSSGAEIASAEASGVVTNVAQLRRLATPEPGASYSFQLEGDVWWSSPAQSSFVLHDASGTEAIEAALPNAPLKPGDRVRLVGNGSLIRRGAAFRIGTLGAVIENDGVHSMTERAGEIYLTEGRHPIRLDWFNGTGRSGLKLEYEGPGIARQKIPDSALWRTKETNASAANGLEYHSFEGAWEHLPDFNQLTAIKAGITPRFDLERRTRDNNVGLQFSGYLEVPRQGRYVFYLASDDGSRLFIGEPTLRSSVIGTSAFPTPRTITIGQLLPGEDENGQWSQIEGKVTFVRKQPEGLQLEVRAGAGAMRVELGEDNGIDPAQLLNRRIRAVGVCQSSFSLDGERVAGLLLVPGRKELTALDAPLNRETIDGEIKSVTGLPWLTSASAVRELRPQEARRGYPVRIRGVVTCLQPDHRAFVIQDSTIGLYVEDSPARSAELPEVGEFIEVEGVTDEPGIARLRGLKRLGEGNLPEPVHPAWDQLMNGSLDSQWVEIGGLIESLIDRSNGWSRVMLRTRAGVLKVDLRRAGVKPGPLEQYENAVVRLRGCMFADWTQALRLKVGQIRMYDVDVLVDRSAPADLFSVPQTTAAALMRFDPAFEVSQRVKVAGQIVYVRGADYFIMDGKDGLRFMARQPLGFEAGDTVEAVGYPELSGAAPVLRAAVARKIAHAPLPEPKQLSPDDLIRSSLDSTRVRVAGMLTGLKQTRTNLVLDMQSGSWRFLARLNTNPPARLPSIGSRLDLVGVYCAQGGLQALGADVAPVDILMSSAADITVLARPPWWTLQRLLVIVGLLACALAVMVLWITQLRQQVDERTTELTIQIQSRQQLEIQRAMEQERARIAQDLHDELGSDIATISMLATRAKFGSASEEKRGQYLDQVRGKTREMVAALDEIVWAMNPVHDSLTSLVNYFGRYADRFLGLANIAWRFENPNGSTDRALDSRQRHQLFLAFKEALTNVVRHSGATEVCITVQAAPKELWLTIIDNGGGRLPTERSEGMTGIDNMRIRIEKLGGRFAVEGKPGQGTSVRFCLPLE